MIRKEHSPRTSGIPLRACKALLAATASLVLIIPAASGAQPQDHRSGGPSGGGQPPSGGRSGAPSHGPRSGGPSAGGFGGTRRSGGFGGGPPATRSQFGPGNTFFGYDGSEQRDSQGGAGDRRGFGGEFTSARRFNGGAYRRPPGWYAHQWRHGDMLPALFWSQDYWLLNYWLYGLSPPPYGYVWVRDGGDALLIDQNTGEIVEVINGVFY